MSFPRLGISNSLPPETKVIYTRVPGRGSVGRTADLLAHAAMFDYKLSKVNSNATGIFAHALLDSAFLIAQNASIYIEYASSGRESHIAVRFSFSDLFEQGVFTLGIEQWAKDLWTHSEEMVDLRVLLKNSDRVEVRFNMKLKLMEWRVSRKLEVASTATSNAEIFVMSDDSDRIFQGSDMPTEMSELPFDKWLEDVYRASSKSDLGSHSGEMYLKGESLQNEIEMSRIISNREKTKVEDTVKKEMSDHCWEDGVENLDLKSTIDAENEQRVDQKAEEILGRIDEVTDEIAKTVIHDAKKKELRAKHDLIVSQRKTAKYEVLLQEKEKTIQKKMSELRVLEKQLAERPPAPEISGNALLFREKALQMAEALKRVKEDNEALERLVFELQQKNKGPESSSESIPRVSGGMASSGGMTVAQQQVEDLMKKVDRVGRALEAEKAKVITLSERVTVAEREAQSSSTIVSDLETKVEHAMKMAQQHKKETESVKQKLVQSDAEKNRIKNELVKAQAQIQTLTKRLAS